MEYNKMKTSCRQNMTAITENNNDGCSVHTNDEKTCHQNDRKKKWNLQKASQLESLEFII